MKSSAMCSQNLHKGVVCLQVMNLNYIVRVLAASSSKARHPCHLPPNAGGAGNCPYMQQML